MKELNIKDMTLVSGGVQWDKVGAGLGAVGIGYSSILLIIILSIVIKGWHNIIPRNIETIQTSDGYELDISAVQKLVQAMSTFQPQVTSGNVSHTTNAPIYATNSGFFVLAAV